MRIIVVDDAEDVLMMAARRGYECHSNAYTAMSSLLTDPEPVDQVFLDVHGITQHGVCAAHVAEACKERGIPVTVTTSNEESAKIFQSLYGCRIGTKLSAMTVARVSATGA